MFELLLKAYEGFKKVSLLYIIYPIRTPYNTTTLLHV